MLFASAMPTHTQKNGALRALVALKRANTSAFCLYDRAAGRALGGCSYWQIRDIFLGAKNSGASPRPGFGIALGAA
jgi:hypothetical protein